MRSSPSQSSHQRVSSQSVPTNMVNRKHRNNAPRPDSSRVLDTMLTTSSRLSSSRYALGRSWRRGFTSSASTNAATTAPMVTICATGRGMAMIVFAPCEPSVLITSSAHTAPTSRGAFLGSSRAVSGAR